MGHPKQPKFTRQMTEAEFDKLFASMNLLKKAPDGGVPQNPGDVNPLLLRKRGLLI